MNKYRAMLRWMGLAAVNAAPYLILPPVSQAIPEALLPFTVWMLCKGLPVAGAALIPFGMARGGMPAIAAWLCPLLCPLLLPLWGLRPDAAAMALSFVAAVVSGVAGEECARRKKAPRQETRRKARRKKR